MKTRQLLPAVVFEDFEADCRDDLIVDLNVAFPFGHEGEVQVASFQDLEEALLVHLVHRAFAFSWDLDSPLVAFQVFASSHVDPSVEPLAFYYHPARVA